MRFVAETVERRQRELVHVIYSVGIGIFVVVDARAREPELRRQIQEYVWRLAEEEVAVAEDGRGEGGRVGGVAGVGGGDEGCEGFHAGFLVEVAGVRVGGAGFFEAEADEFAAAGDGGPVEEFVGWGWGVGGGGFLAFGGGGGCHG